jgi:hypothetical protein
MWWYVFQIAVFTGIVWWSDSWTPHDLVTRQGAIVIGFMATALSTAIVREFLDWRQGRATIHPED